MRKKKKTKPKQPNVGQVLVCSTTVIPSTWFPTHGKYQVWVYAIPNCLYAKHRVTCDFSSVVTKLKLVLLILYQHTVCAFGSCLNAHAPSYSMKISIVKASAVPPHTTTASALCCTSHTGWELAQPKAGTAVHIR